MISQRQAVCQNSYVVLSRIKIGANLERVSVEVTQPKRHWFSRPKKEIIRFTKPIYGGQGWRDRVSLDYGSYSLLDDLLLWVAVYYPMISETSFSEVDPQTQAETIEEASIMDDSPIESEKASVDTTPEPHHESLVVESRSESYESHNHGESHRTHDIGDHHVDHSDYSSHDSYDGGGGGGDCGGGSCGGCD
jgi:hypothetical protein